MLIHHAAILEAGHSCYASVFADELEERGGSFASGGNIAEQVERLADEAQLPIMWRYLGRIEQAWGHDAGLVLYHMGLRDVERQSTALFLLIMGCMGHGISIRDEWDAEFDSACERLGIADGDEASMLFVPMEWRDLAATVQDVTGLAV